MKFEQFQNIFTRNYPIAVPPQVPTSPSQLVDWAYGQLTKSR